MPPVGKIEPQSFTVLNILAAILTTADRGCPRYVDSFNAWPSCLACRNDRVGTRVHLGQP
jgi:hypothetical protein